MGQASRLVIRFRLPKISPASFLRAPVSLSQLRRNLVGVSRFSSSGGQASPGGRDGCQGLGLDLSGAAGVATGQGGGQVHEAGAGLGQGRGETTGLVAVQGR